MKNQYVGDIGDYGKYGLLRFLRDAGVGIGVNWYLTPDDASPDGRHTEYLADARMRAYDPELYDAMGRIAPSEGKSVQMVEGDGVLDGMRFYGAMLDLSQVHWRQRPGARSAWHQGAVRALEDADLVFLDPDNGLSAKKKPTQKDAEKFVLPGEVVDYYTCGQQVVYYHHRPRKGEAGWLADKRMMVPFLPDARLLAVSFRRWSVRSYIFVVHDDQYERYARLMEDFLASSWGSHPVDGKVAFAHEDV